MRSGPIQKDDDVAFLARCFPGKVGICVFHSNVGANEIKRTMEEMQSATLAKNESEKSQKRAQNSRTGSRSESNRLAAKLSCGDNSIQRPNR